MKKIKITEKQFIKLQEDLEYWSVSEASPSSDTYEMGVDMTEQFYPEDDRSYLVNFDTAFKDFNNPSRATRVEPFDVASGDLPLNSLLPCRSL